MKKLLLLLFSFFTLGSFFSQQFSWQWYKKQYDENLQTVNDIVIDSARGYVYAVGTFEGDLSADFVNGTQTVSSRGDKDGFVAQFDLQGNCLWSFNIGGRKNDEINAIDIDKSTGDIFVVGYGIRYRPTFFFSNQHFRFGDASGNYHSHNSNDGDKKKDLIVAKYNLSGNYIWGDVDGGERNDIVSDVTVLQGLDCMVYTGVFKTVSNYDGLELGGEIINFNDSQKHMFLIARKKSNGGKKWLAYSVSGNAQEGIALSNDGTNIYLAGGYSGPMDINIDLSSGSVANLGSLTNPSSPGNQSIFYSKFQALTGAPFWLKSIGSSAEDRVGDIKVVNNKLYIGGGVSNNTSFDGSPTYPVSNGFSMFISEHDLNGFVLNNIIEQNTTSTARSMVTALDLTNDYIVAGGFTSGGITFNNQTSETLTSLGQLDGFVAYYKPSTLAYVGREHILGTGNNIPYGLASLSRDVYVGGRYGLGASLNHDISMTNEGNETGFLSFLEFQCSTSLSYGFNSICSESAVMSPAVSSIGGTFSYLGTNTLSLNTVSGLIDPFQSQGGNYQIVYHDLIGCSDTFDIVITAGLMPQFTSCPTDYTVYTSNSNCGAAYLYTGAGFQTDCGSNIVAQTDGSGYFNGDVFPVGSTLQEFVVSDGYNPNDTCRFTITVVDTISPTFNNCPVTDVIAYSGSTSCAVVVDYGTITATDNCSIGTTTLTMGPISNSTFPLDTTAILFTSVDINSNQSTCSFNVIVVDTVSPYFSSCPSISDTVKYYVDGSCTAEITFSAPQAIDNCDFKVFQSYGDQSGALVQPVSFDYRLFTAIDSSGNSSVCRTNYTVLDTVSPTITCPNDVVLDADVSSCKAVYSYSSPVVDDNCTLYTVTAVQIDGLGFSSGDEYPIGITNQAFQIQDIYGNTSYCDFDITVENITEAGEFSNGLEGVCSDAEVIDLNQYVDASLNGAWEGDGVVGSNFDVGSANIGVNEIIYIVGGTSCSDTLVHEINVYSFLAQAGTDDSLCGLSYQLEANASTGVSQNWIQQGWETYQSEINPSTLVTVEASGIYSFVWKVEKDQCLKTDTIEVVFYEAPIADAGYDETVEENEIELDGVSNAGIGYWTVVSSDGTIEDSSLYNTMVTDLNLGLNTFEWTVENGVCTASSDQVRIFYDYLKIPNAFTPNGDGINDFFYIVGFDLQSEAELTIIDRWGEKIFFTNDVGEYWDGTYKGKDAVADTYFYILYIRGKELTGYIELRR